MCYCPTPTLHLNLALAGDGAFLFSLKKTHSVWLISVLNYGDTENVLINHLLLVIPMSYPCHYTNLCPHKPHKHAHTHRERERESERERERHTIHPTPTSAFSSPPFSFECKRLSLITLNHKSISTWLRMAQLWWLTAAAEAQIWIILSDGSVATICKWWHLNYQLIVKW